MKKGFVLTSFLLTLSSTMAIVSTSPVFSLIFLIISFLLASVIMISLGCEFLALIFIIVYVGAISILFLFTIMMLESKMINLSKNSKQSFPVGVFFGILFCLPLIKDISHFYKQQLVRKKYYTNTQEELWLEWQLWGWEDLTTYAYQTDIETIGRNLYSLFILQFLISGMLLLLILVGVVYLLNNLKKKKITGQSSFKQLSRNSNFLIFGNKKLF